MFVIWALNLFFKFAPTKWADYKWCRYLMDLRYTGTHWVFVPFLSKEK